MAPPVVEPPEVEPPLLEPAELEPIPPLVLPVLVSPPVVLPVVEGLFPPVVAGAPELVPLEAPAVVSSRPVALAPLADPVLVPVLVPPTVPVELPPLEVSTSNGVPTQPAETANSNVNITGFSMGSPLDSGQFTESPSPGKCDSPTLAALVAPVPFAGSSDPAGMVVGRVRELFGSATRGPGSASEGLGLPHLIFAPRHEPGWDGGRSAAACSHHQLGLNTRVPGRGDGPSREKLRATSGRATRDAGWNHTTTRVTRQEVG